ncbi:glycosyltransferase [Shewanella algae]|nr:glycosyltransferase [Shewanella algae]
MKIVLLAPANSIHSIRWANGLAERGHSIYLVSAHTTNAKFHKNVNLHILENLAPAGYITAFVELKNLLAQIAPDILNAHYATGYGLLARLTRFKPLILSVWGSDVYDFPQKSIFHRALLRGNLKSATALASTSHCMLKETCKTYNHSNAFITPFGVDHTLFTPEVPGYVSDERVVVGTVKNLSYKYGIDILIQAFSKVFYKLGEPNWLYLEICGGGESLDELRRLVSKLGIEKQVEFIGNVQYENVPNYIARFDIFVALSRLNSESFGVAIVEANACGKPVVVSDADGPKEVTLDGVTGYVVAKGSVDEAAEKMELLINNKSLRKEMGEAARKHVLEQYTWDKSVDIMLESYKQTISLSGN